MISALECVCDTLCVHPYAWVGYVDVASTHLRCATANPFSLKLNDVTLSARIARSALLIVEIIFCFGCDVI